MENNEERGENGLTDSSDDVSGQFIQQDRIVESESSDKIYIAENGDRKFRNTGDWRIYNREKYSDPSWSPELE